MTTIRQPVEIPQGDTRRLPFSVVTADGSAQNLAGADIEWRLGDEASPVLSTTDPGARIVERDNAAGTFVVELSADATDTLAPQSYDELLTVVDGAGNVTQFTGTIFITEI